MKKPAKDRIREERIRNEVIVDAYGPQEQVMGWRARSRRARCRPSDNPAESYLDICSAIFRQPKRGFRRYRDQSAAS